MMEAFRWRNWRRELPTSAIVVGVGVLLTKSPLGRVIRYVYRHLFGEPVSNWLRRVIKDQGGVNA